MGAFSCMKVFFKHFLALLYKTLLIALYFFKEGNQYIFLKSLIIQHKKYLKL